MNRSNSAAAAAAPDPTPGASRKPSPAAARTPPPAAKPEPFRLEQSLERIEQSLIAMQRQGSRAGAAPALLGRMNHDLRETQELIAALERPGAFNPADKSGAELGQRVVQLAQRLVKSEQFLHDVRSTPNGKTADHCAAFATVAEEGIKCSAHLRARLIEVYKADCKELVADRIKAELEPTLKKLLSGKPQAEAAKIQTAFLESAASNGVRYFDESVNKRPRPAQPALPTELGTRAEKLGIREALVQHWNYAHNRGAVALAADGVAAQLSKTVAETSALFAQIKETPAPTAPKPALGPAGSPAVINAAPSPAPVPAAAGAAAAGTSTSTVTHAGGAAVALNSSPAQRVTSERGVVVGPVTDMRNAKLELIRDLDGWSVVLTAKPELRLSESLRSKALQIWGQFKHKLGEGTMRALADAVPFREPERKAPATLVFKLDGDRRDALTALHAVRNALLLDLKEGRAIFGRHGDKLNLTSDQLASSKLRLASIENADLGGQSLRDFLDNGSEKIKLVNVTSNRGKFKTLLIDPGQEQCIDASASPSLVLASSLKSRNFNVGAESRVEQHRAGNVVVELHRDDKGYFIRSRTRENLGAGERQGEVYLRLSQQFGSPESAAGVFNSICDQLDLRKGKLDAAALINGKIKNLHVLGETKLFGTKDRLGAVEAVELVNMNLAGVKPYRGIPAANITVDRCYTDGGRFKLPMLYDASSMQITRSNLAVSVGWKAKVEALEVDGDSRITGLEKAMPSAAPVSARQPPASRQRARN